VRNGYGSGWRLHGEITREEREDGRPFLCSYFQYPLRKLEESDMTLKGVMARISFSNEARCLTNGDVLGGQKMAAVHSRTDLRVKLRRHHALGFAMLLYSGEK
jgi:hypothetical protein